MNQAYKKLDRHIRILRIAYLSYGLPLTILSLLAIVMFYIYIDSTYIYQPVPSLLIWSAIIYATYFISGILMILTYFGLKFEIKNIKLIGIIVCIIPALTIFIYSITTGAYYFDISYLLILIPSFSILLFTLYLWGEIPNNKNIKISKRTKKIISVILIVIFISGILIYFIPNIQKSMALDSLEYSNYYYGWGFNPPDGWSGGTVSQGGNLPSAHATFYPSGHNTSEVSLDIYGCSIGESPNLENIAKDRLDSFEDISWHKYTSNFSLISHGSRTINGMDAYEIIYYWESIPEKDTNITKIKQKDIFIKKGETLVCVYYISLSDYYDLFDSVVEKSLKLFAIS